MKRIPFLLPSVITPYAVLVTLWFVFIGANQATSAGLSHQSIQTAIFGMIVTCLLLLIVTLLFGGIACLSAFVKPSPASSLTKTVLAVQCVRLPAVLILSVLSVILLITIFTIPFAVVLWLLLAVIMITDALLLIAALVTANRQGYALYQTHWWVILLQFLPCLGTAAVWILYRKLRKCADAECV